MLPLACPKFIKFQTWQLWLFVVQICQFAPRKLLPKLFWRNMKPNELTRRFSFCAHKHIIHMVRAKKHRLKSKSILNHWALGNQWASLPFLSHLTCHCLGRSSVMSQPGQLRSVAETAKSLAGTSPGMVWCYTTPVKSVACLCTNPRCCFHPQSKTTPSIVCY